MNKHFPKLRSVILFCSFLIFTFGVYIFGKKFLGFEIPSFICPVNREGSLEGSCYTLSHLESFFQYNGFQEILKFFLLTLLAIVLLGRMICGFLCPFGFIQDIIFKIKNLLRQNPIKFGDKYRPMIHIIKWGMLFIFLFIGFFGANFCEICPVIAFVPLVAGDQTTLQFSFFVGIIVIVGSFFKKRFWCNICPLGYLVGLLHKISIFKLKKDCQACTECGACYEACPMEIKSIYTEREKNDITTADCLFCSECVKVCPEDNAIGITCMGKKIYNASRESFEHNRIK